MFHTLRSSLHLSAFRIMNLTDLVGWSGLECLLGLSVSQAAFFPFYLGGGGSLYYRQLHVITGYYRFPEATTGSYMVQEVTTGY